MLELTLAPDWLLVLSAFAQAAVKIGDIQQNIDRNENEQSEKR